MNHRMPHSAWLLLLPAMLASANAASRNDQPADATQPERGGEPAVAQDAESMIDAFARYAMPGVHHNVLERMVGNWGIKVKYRMNADAPVVESEGTSIRKWILGKRFVLEEFDGGHLAMPFKGFAIYGYDSFEDKYTSAWLDTMNTAITTYKGLCKLKCKAIAFEGLHGDPWTGTKRRSRGITRFVDNDRQVVEIYEPDADGREFKILEIRYERSQP
ncbi:MAG: DUF1579 family protein [Phycisphaerae bacterium]